jgi:hypothetical protein
MPEEGALGQSGSLGDLGDRGVDLGFLGMVLALDCPAWSTLTRELLGWRPVQPGLIEDLDKGHYFALGGRQSC